MWTILAISSVTQMASQLRVTTASTQPFAYAKLIRRLRLSYANSIDILFNSACPPIVCQYRTCNTEGTRQIRQHSPMECFTISCVPFYVCNYRGNPDSVETHALDIVELVNDTLVVSTAIAAVICVTCRTRTVRGCKSIGHQLQKESVGRDLNEPLIYAPDRLTSYASRPERPPVPLEPQKRERECWPAWWG